MNIAPKYPTLRKPRRVGQPQCDSLNQSKTKPGPASQPQCDSFNQSKTKPGPASPLRSPCSLLQSSYRAILEQRSTGRDVMLRPYVEFVHICSCQPRKSG